MKQVDPRRLAYDVLLRVEDGAYADLALDAALKHSPRIDPRDRGLATELVYGVLRQQGRIDFALSRFCKQPLEKLETKVLILLRLGAHQILHLDRVPSRAAVHSAVELARQEGLERATGFLNGVLRNLDRKVHEIPWPDAASKPEAYLEHVLSLPRWVARRWLRQYGPEETICLAKALSQPAPFTLRVNTLRTDRDSFLEALSRSGHEAHPTTFAPEGVIVSRRGAEPLPGSAEGWFQVQDEASMLVAHLLDPQSEERLLDVCAAPGGKTTHLAALTGNRSRITALDLHPRRVDLIREGAARLGCQGIEARPWDLTVPPDFLAPQNFDRILVDAPCSGLGVLRRNPELRWRRTEKDLGELATLQRSILGNVASLLRPGGALVYSLCTQTPEESTEVVDDFLEKNPCFHREDLRQTVPSNWQPLFDERGDLRTFPHRHGGMDAFYAVRLRRED